ncbi:uncharacterized protein NESG_00254 [Nematocida ausubeli]|uniref:Arf-GAP domain-containing protein n=1 Tax=Nematocida ausubeli (strain ATCC PRA-371 / ERTm2) TaxID=1913371 RepID=A0A086J4W0_NEMA1|nr:uncharacterized protein NESG_00254 [Nematocida ausubeli]KAI5132899.1 ADP-ribosylation factor GTPase-activating protein 1 [Nematocida ausubeli]KFG27178.1 hypothetical protein NESG_00254 [Nematocida ausubeli]
MPCAKETMSLKQIIASTDANSKCIDCNMTRPQWASITYGVFLCLNCAGVHRSYGVKVSMVKSLSMDIWNDSEKKRMELGGNKNFFEYVQKNGLEGLPKKELYTSSKMKTYVDALQKSVEEIFPQAKTASPSSPKERRKKVETTPSPSTVNVCSGSGSGIDAEVSQSSYVNMYNQASTMAMPALGSLQTGISEVFGKAAEYFSYASSTISEQISEKVITPASSMIKERGEQLSEYIKGKDKNRRAQEKESSREAKPKPTEKKPHTGSTKASYDKWD